MTVKDLIKELENCRQDAEVYLPDDYDKENACSIYCVEDIGYSSTIPSGVYIIPE